MEGYVALEGFNSRDSTVQVAVEAAATSLSERGYNPEEFLVKVESEKTEILVWLIHQRILKIKEPFPGNSADGQICSFDKTTSKLGKCLYLQ